MPMFVLMPGLVGKSMLLGRRGQAPPRPVFHVGSESQLNKPVVGWAEFGNNEVYFNGLEERPIKKASNLSAQRLPSFATTVPNLSASPRTPFPLLGARPRSAPPEATNRDAMGEKEKRARAAESDKSSRKAPRLEPQDSVCGDAAAAETDKTPSPELKDSGCPGTPLPARSGSMEVAVGSDTSSAPCRHFLATEEETELLLAKIESLKYGPDPACECCVLESANVGQKSHPMVCTQCDQCLCSSVLSSEDAPWGHARRHARENEHWVALWFSKPETGYCFFCDDQVHLHKSGGGSDRTSSDNDESVSSEVKPEAAAGGGHGYASGSNADERGYVIRGIPNLGNTCYMNVVVQCLLVLDKLRTVMLGPNAPSGSIGRALAELFVETRASNDTRVALNPQNLLNNIRALHSEYNSSTHHDSHELLGFLRGWLNEEQLNRAPNRQDGASGAAITTVDSIFEGELSDTRTTKCCQSKTVDHRSFYDLQLPLASKKHPNKSIASPQRTHRSQRKSPAKQLFPAVEECNSEKVQTIADGGDSDITHTELDYVAMEKTPEPLEVDYSEAVQIHQTVHCPLLTHKDVVSCSERSQGIIEVPLKFLDLLSDSLFSDKVEEMLEPMADSNSPEDRVPPPFDSPVRIKNVIVASGNDLEQKGKENTSTEQITREVHREAKERTCMIQVTKEDKGKDLSCIDKKAEDSSFHASIMDCLELFFKEEVIEARCEKCSKGPQQPSTIGSKDGGQMVASTDGNTSVDSNKIEKEYMSKYKDQEVTISKLPPVLTVQLVRFEMVKDNIVDQDKIKGCMSFEENLDVRQSMDQSSEDNNSSYRSLKMIGHVKFEENLDVGPYVDSRSEDKNNSSYRLVGVIEHIGDSLKSGHYVAYVRGSRNGSDQQLRSGSSSWFRVSDKIIRQVSIEDVLKCEAFILFYERIER